MLKNYFKIAWRQLSKSKFYSFINIGGLSVGLAVGILILLWAKDELSYDRFHKNEADIYKLENMAGTGTSRQIWTNTAAPIGLLAKKEIPGIKEVARLSYNGIYNEFLQGDKKITEDKTWFADASLFTVFDFNIIEGNAANPFPNANTVVLSESGAKKFFGNENAIGKVLVTDEATSFTVTGIIKDIPANSSIQGDMFLPMSALAREIYRDNKEGLNIDNDFHQFNYDTYLLMDPATSLTPLPDKIRNIHLRQKADDVDVAYMFLPLGKMHLYHSDGSDNGMSAVTTFIVIAIIILVIACINYVNLSTSRSMLRAKEVSLRKIVGAAKWQLFSQFIVETAVVFLLSTILALGLMYVLMPPFNQLSGKTMIFSLADPELWKVLAIAIAGTLVASSIYPALLLSSFEPIKALKGKISAKLSDTFFRKALVVTQFSLSIILIAGTIVITRQLNYLRSKNLGYDKEHVFVLNMRNMNGHFEAVKAELLKSDAIADITWANSNIINNGMQTGNNNWAGKQEGETLMLSPMSIDKDFISFFKLPLASGKGFTGVPADTSYYILNETAVAAARMTNPIGAKFSLWGRGGTIIGVTKDFHFGSLREKIKPAIFYYNPERAGGLYVKAKPQQAAAAIAAVEKQWAKYNADIPFSYSFLDETVATLYKAEERTNILVKLFSGIAIFISCLGLLGLAAYTAQQRTKEIGVRKVLGASVAGITGLLINDFVKLVIIAMVIAIPVAWYVAQQWLQDFAYKMDLQWTVFAAAGIIALLIAVITISFQSIKAALANPVISLKNE